MPNVFEENSKFDTLSRDALAARIHTLAAQVQLCVDHMDEKGILEEHCLTFPDGETVWATQTLSEEQQ